MNHRHLTKYQIYRGTQFNLTHCDLPIKRLLASKCNKYILKYLQHTLWTPSSIPVRSTHQNHQRSLVNHRHLTKYQIYRGTQFNLTHCDSPIKRLLASKRNQNQYKSSSTHISAHHQTYITLYPSKSSEITTKSHTFQKTIRLLAKHNSISHFAIYQSKDSSPLNVINIFWSIINTHYVHHQAYTYAIPIKILRDHN